jgi:hypothetical protein
MERDARHGSGRWGDAFRALMGGLDERRNETAEPEERSRIRDGDASLLIDTSDGEDCIIDVDGLELADSEAARRAALDALPDMARDVIPDGDRRRFVMTVRDDARRVLYSASLTPRR